ncbi:MAG: DUF2147 domain-containing protein [Desulfamplus sp.]|nr:DUF2147 domain-containing protein [Desulfamplus sp.]
MKRAFVGVIISVVAVLLCTVSVKAENTIAGTWKTVSDEGADKGKDKSYVEIFEKNGAYFAKITKLLLKPQDTLCDKCVGDLYNKPLAGMIFLQDMKKSGKIDSKLGEEYSDGTIMDPDNGKSYKCKMWIKDDVLTLRGYIGFLYRTQQWFRTN